MTMMIDIDIVIDINSIFFSLYNFCHTNTHIESSCMSCHDVNLSVICMYVYIYVYVFLKQNNVLQIINRTQGNAQ